MATLTCSRIVSLASDYLDGVLRPEERAEVDAHLEGCDACPQHLAQLRTTIKILAERPDVVVPDELRRVLAETSATRSLADVAAQAATDHTGYLLTLARAFRPDTAEDAIQSTWLRALDEGPEAFTRERLTQLLFVQNDDEPEVRSWNAHDGGADATVEQLDADADEAELFYPAFYGEGPDAGAWINQPNAWPGENRILGPESDLTTTELYGVVDDALGDLSPLQATAVSLVDFEGVSSEHAAATLGIEVVDLRRALSAARNHLRGSLDGYLVTAA
jgi:DNA-directed RNA polymerase specialized sigma24 family protein